MPGRCIVSLAGGPADSPRPQDSSLPSVPHALSRLLPALLSCVVLLVAGCSSKPAVRTSGPGVDRPYTVKGRTYYPLKSAEGFTQEGIASWYGPGFHGKPTSSGEPFNQNALTAAHTILPFQSEVEVTNLRNGRSVVVRINDRGPFSSSRVIDLSRAAAMRLDFIGTGTTRVRIRHVNAAAPLATPASPAPARQVSGVFFIQVGAFGNRNTARALAGKGARYGSKGHTVAGNKGLWRVLFGPWSSLDAANDALWRVREDFPQAFVVSED